LVYRQQAMQMAGGMGRIPGILFLAIVIVAIAALLAGYGVPVGVGALAGLVFGAIAGALGTLWLARGSGRSISLAGVEWSSDMTSGAMSAELMADMREMTEVFGIDLGPIRSILPVLATFEAIEQHEAGARVTLDVRALPGTLPPPGTAHVSVTDSVGTHYQASAQAQGGSPNQMRYEIVVVPSLMLTSHELTVRVDRFVDLFPGARRAAVGPWVFVVPLDPDDR
jgi:hypothetical protein